MRQNEELKKGVFAVKRKRFAVEQIVGVLKQAEVGVPVRELVLRNEISAKKFRRQKKQHAGTVKLSCLAPFSPPSTTSKSLIPRLASSRFRPQIGIILLNLTVPPILPDFALN